MQKNNKKPVPATLDELRRPYRGHPLLDSFVELVRKDAQQRSITLDCAYESAFDYVSSKGLAAAHKEWSTPSRLIHFSDGMSMLLSEERFNQLSDPERLYSNGRTLWLSFCKGEIDAHAFNVSLMQLVRNTYPSASKDAHHTVFSVLHQQVRAKGA